MSGIPNPHSKVHPHVCGEDLPLADQVAVNIGSPPRVWGRHAGQQVQRGLHRFTPTCVGKTQSICVDQNQGQVHPHVCGEDCPLAANR